MSHAQKWTPAEDALLRTRHGDWKIEDIARHLNRTLASVSSRATKLKLASGRRFGRVGPVAGSSRCLSHSDKAAEYLRRHDRTQVFRCTSAGRPDPRGNHYRYGFGHVVLTDEELVAKAERKGWLPDAWRELAA